MESVNLGHISRQPEVHVH